MDKRISRQYFNNAASHWDETVRNNDPVKLQELAERLAFPPDALVLDVGTGTGVFVPYIQGKLNGSGRITCVDFAFRMLEIAQKKNGNEGIEHICAESRRWDLPVECLTRRCAIPLFHTFMTNHYR